MHNHDENIRPDRDLNLVPPDYKPQSVRMSHRGRLYIRGIYAAVQSQKAISVHLTSKQILLFAFANSNSEAVSAYL